jgi:phospholipid/cholesterol/gamma-HCH transport system substrate-binding protein
MNAGTRTRLIGLAVIVVVAGGAWLGIVKPNPFETREVVHVMFDRIQSLAQVQRDVRVAGVNVGTIGDVRRIGDRAEVDLVLNQWIPVYRDATAALRPHTPFEGTTFVDLWPGTPAAGRLGNRAIPLSQTSVFVSAGDVLSTFTARVRRSFQVIVSQLSEALRRPGQIGLGTAIHNAPSLLEQTSVVAPALRGPHETELRALIPSAAATVDALAGEDGQLQRAIHNASRTLDAIAVDDAKPFDQTLSVLPATLTAATSAALKVTSVLHQAGATATALTPALGAIAPTTGPLVTLFHRANSTLRTVPPVIDAFAATLTRLGDASPALGRLFATLAPAAKLLDGSLIPFLNSRGALGLPVYLQLMAATTGFTGALSGFVAPSQRLAGGAIGHALRGTLQGPFTLPPGALNSPIACTAIAKLNPSAVSLAAKLGLCAGQP